MDGFDDDYPYIPAFQAVDLETDEDMAVSLGKTSELNASPVFCFTVLSRIWTSMKCDCNLRLLTFVYIDRRAKLWNVYIAGMFP